MPDRGPCHSSTIKPTGRLTANSHGQLDTTRIAEPIVGPAAPDRAITMAFQPIVDVYEQRIDGYEALVRGPEGQSAQSVLAQLTDENRYAFDQACRVRAIELAASLGMDRQLSINFLPNAVYEPRACISATLEAARRTGFDPRRLTFEIVETESITDTPHLLRIIAEYHRQGFKVALDDFASGYSGLTRLADLRPDIIKLDRALIAGCDRDRTRMAIARNMICLAEEIGVKLVVEGVETAQEVGVLQAAGARYMQGYYFARPSFGKLVSDGDIFAAKSRIVCAGQAGEQAMGSVARSPVG